MPYPTVSVLAAGLTALSVAGAATAGGIELPTNRETVYRLNSGASYQDGCFEPCDCPLNEQADVIGTFVLGPLHIGDAFNFREVREVYWTVQRGNELLRITGDGGYFISNWGEPPFHSMSLDLSINDGPTQHFFSDLHQIESNDGSIDLVVSINGVHCDDIVIDVEASPVAENEIRRYSLGNASTFQRGCFDPCDCLLEEPRSLIGGFGLVPLDPANTSLRFAVVQARFLALPPVNIAPPIELRGSGRYEQIHQQNVLQQRMTLLMHEDDANIETLLFDSGVTLVHVPLPRIRVTLDTNGQVCFDTVLNLHTGPVKKSQDSDMMNAGDRRSVLQQDD